MANNTRKNTRKNRKNMSGGQNAPKNNAAAVNAPKNNAVKNNATKNNKTGGKRKLSGYMKFAMGERKKLPKTMKFTAQGKELGKRWRALSVSEKKKF